MSRLLLFDPYAGGHHADHIRWVASAWADRGVEGDLVLAVDERQFEDAPDLLDIAASASIHVHRIPADPGGSLRQFAQRARRHLTDVAHRYQPDGVLAMYLDTAQPALALRVPLPHETRLAGVLFRPDLHYAALGSPAQTLRERLTRLRKRAVLSLALRHPQLSDVFSLDPTAVPAIQALTSTTRVHALPDPAHIDPPTRAASEVRAALGIEPGRHLGLLIGSLSQQKGASVLLDAVGRLGPAHAGRLAVVLAGRAPEPLRARIVDRLEALRETTEAQVIFQDGFVPHDDVQNLVAASDQILVPYQRHTGSSGILMRAAAAGVPVLSQAWGLMGHQVREHRLGQTIDASSASAIAAGLARAIDDPHSDFDAASASAFADRHTVEAFTSRLLDPLLQAR